MAKYQSYKILLLAFERGETPDGMVLRVLAKHNGHVAKSAADMNMTRQGLDLYLKKNQWSRDPVTRQWSPPEKKLNQTIELIA